MISFPADSVLTSHVATSLCSRPPLTLSSFLSLLFKFAAPATAKEPAIIRVAFLVVVSLSLSAPYFFKAKKGLLLRSVLPSIFVFLWRPFYFIAVLETIIEGFVIVLASSSLSLSCPSSSILCKLMVPSNAKKNSGEKELLTSIVVKSAPPSLVLSRSLLCSRPFVFYSPQRSL